MIFAIGCDIEDISRFENKSQKFYDGIFTVLEQEYCFSKPNPAQHFAARYCGKESVTKALFELGIRDVYYKDIEVLRNDLGFPVVNIIKDSGLGLDIKISLSHCKDKAMANVMVIKKASF